jgi:hypothetical protein
MQKDCCLRSKLLEIKVFFRILHLKGCSSELNFLLQDKAARKTGCPVMKMSGRVEIVRHNLRCCHYLFSTLFQGTEARLSLSCRPPDW